MPGSICSPEWQGWVRCPITSTKSLNWWARRRVASRMQSKPRSSERTRPCETCAGLRWCKPVVTWRTARFTIIRSCSRRASRWRAKTHSKAGQRPVRPKRDDATLRLQSCLLAEKSRPRASAAGSCHGSPASCSPPAGHGIDPILQGCHIRHDLKRRLRRERQREVVLQLMSADPQSPCCRRAAAAVPHPTCLMSPEPFRGLPASGSWALCVQTATGA